MIKLKNNSFNLSVLEGRRNNCPDSLTLSKTKGITLVELIVTISLIAILASISIPIYSDYRTRAKIGGEITKVGSLKAQINEIISMSDLTEGDQIRNIYISGVFTDNCVNFN
ncbi:prepilin-type N-terminal cleavage/methylation domain-containing protein [Francisella sp. 19X1-34]|uniref:pilin n=1 Tax=Francisella sp. 19X1-34 TaxID=3087177 RepID=UPI002E2EA75A|nr:prepilin-type N-terminal cleavage/methylation domain-containing protein [Francisella sp. 19X1-34]MED7789519.1 prepilin-type N-terminal cleavage/methylation domain-containing protein [Francisella sp. 19X1-34]